jgi:hypothetical protein
VRACGGATSITICIIHFSLQDQKINAALVCQIKAPSLQIIGLNKTAKELFRTKKVLVTQFVPATGWV